MPFGIFFVGVPRGTRTLDPLIKSQLRYQLSSGGDFFQKRVKKYCFFLIYANIFAKKIQIEVIFLLISFFFVNFAAKCKVVFDIL